MSEPTTVSPAAPAGHAAPAAPATPAAPSAASVHASVPAGTGRPTHAGGPPHGASLGGPSNGASAAGAPVALPPITIEGWYVHHQLFTVDRAALRAMDPAARAAAARALADALDALATPEDGGWSAAAVLVGSQADAMLVHFRPTIDALGAAQRTALAAASAAGLTPSVTFLSVTEAGMYYLAAQLAKSAAERGGKVGDEQYEREAAERIAVERDTPHIQKRLFPERPAAMPYVCFYPMSKRRAPEQNWYEQTLEERNRLMWAHGKTGRRYAGKVSQVVTGSIGFDVWEWGVTLFAADPLEFKRIVTEMRFDEVSAKYAEFGAFYVGKVEEPAAFVAAVLGG